MTNNDFGELTEYEIRLNDAVRAKTNDEPCPRCENTTYYFLGPTGGAWLTLCCQKCGFKLEHLVDVLLEDLDEE